MRLNGSCHIGPVSLQAEFKELDLWDDQRARTAVECMAIDSYLAENVKEKPLLRVYRWSEAAISIGYFGTYPQIREQEVSYVRRITGGGLVDHRLCQTYTLIIPRTHSLARRPARESYCVIHKAIAEILGSHAKVIDHDMEGERRGSCATEAVLGDIVCQQTGKKLAGAGQKRTRDVLLHQGCIWTEFDITAFGQRLATLLAEKYQNICISVDETILTHHIARFSC